MTTAEKILLSVAMCWLFAAVLLHLLHLIEASQTVLLLTAGLGLASIPRHRYLQRLRARNAELEALLQQRNS